MSAACTQGLWFSTKRAKALSFSLQHFPGLQTVQEKQFQQDKTSAGAVLDRVLKNPERLMVEQRETLSFWGGPGRNRPHSDNKCNEVPQASPRKSDPAPPPYPKPCRGAGCILQNPVQRGIS